MKRKLAGMFLAAALTTAALSPAAQAAQAPRLVVNGSSLGTDAMATVVQNTTYVSLRAVSTALAPEAAVTWEQGSAMVRASGLTITATPGASQIYVNGSTVSVPLGVKLQNGRTLVPVRALADAFGAQVEWNAASNTVTVQGGTEQSTYDPDALYWLSRIISAESQGEPLEGKIAVGNVVLSRVASADFPDTVYGVIFDERWGGPFEPVRNGAIHDTPTEESVYAAKLCLQGKRVVEDCLYFLNPSIAQNYWIMENREYITTIGRHAFYR